jgi:hypothetical protein
VLACLVWTAAPAFAQNSDFPPVENLCSGPKCTDTMRAIVADYQASGTFFAVEQIPVFASGGCYHIHPNLDPIHEHFGGFLFDVNAEGTPVFDGLFSYFAASNPYAGYTVEDARKRFEGDRYIDFTINPDGAYAMIPSAKAKLYYWFRRNEEKREMYLISYWSFSDSGGDGGQRIFCRFNY